MHIQIAALVLPYTLIVCSFTFWDGVKNMDYLEAAFRSAAEGKWVNVH